MIHREVRSRSAARRRVFEGVLAAMLAAFVVSTVGITPAHADSQFQIAWTDIGIYPRAAASMDSAKVGAALPDGATVSIVCEIEGQNVSNGYQTTNVWERLSDGTYLPNAYIATNVVGWTPGVPRCDVAPPAPVQPRTYDGRKAATWAVDRSGIPETFKDGDCTFFVSQALWVGGLAQTPEWTSYSTDWGRVASKFRYPGPTRTAAGADIFKNYFVSSGLGTIREIAWSDNTAGGAQLGDIIAYDWDNGADGRIDHLAIVTAFNDQGYPSVTQHTPTQVHRYWSWSLNGNNWIEFVKPGARAYLLHVTK
jgi:hypothetical protein